MANKLKSTKAKNADPGQLKQEEATAAKAPDAAKAPAAAAKAPAAAKK